MSNLDDVAKDISKLHAKTYDDMKRSSTKQSNTSKQTSSSDDAEPIIVIISDDSSSINKKTASKKGSNPLHRSILEQSGVAVPAPDDPNKKEDKDISREEKLRDQEALLKRLRMKEARLKLKHLYFQKKKKLEKELDKEQFKLLELKNNYDNLFCLKRKRQRTE